MKLFSWVILLAVLCLLPDNAAPAKKSRRKRFSIGELSKIVSVLPKAGVIIKEMSDLWNVLLREPDLNISDAIFRSKEHEMIGRLLMISSKLSNLESKVATLSDTTISTILQAFPKIIKLELNLHTLKLITNQINFAEEQLREYLILGYKNSSSEEILISNPDLELAFLSQEKQNQSYDRDVRVLDEMSNNIMKRETDTKWVMEKFTLVDFATWATGHGFNSLLSLLRRMNDLVVAEDNGGLFETVNEISQEEMANATKGIPKVENPKAGMFSAKKEIRHFVEYWMIPVTLNTPFLMSNRKKNFPHKTEMDAYEKYRKL